MYAAYVVPPTVIGCDCPFCSVEGVVSVALAATGAEVVDPVATGAVVAFATDLGAVVVVVATTLGFVVRGCTTGEVVVLPLVGAGLNTLRYPYLCGLAPFERVTATIVMMATTTTAAATMRQCDLIQSMVKFSMAWTATDVRL